jgi:hypothetical protein
MPVMSNACNAALREASLVSSMPIRRNEVTDVSSQHT